ncbi:zinc ribbon domain-containing protein [Desulfurococcus amylolyticus]|uniref:zinc ribbon domain-containing protein n=1 Tax=Desulfurococcus amylolyticus TaxID=94694 RepID=UPI00068CB3F8|nr:zinc ribbon domain-containing protein [Desulfurococcus amylolyticus]
MVTDHSIWGSWASFKPNGTGLTSRLPRSDWQAEKHGVPVVTIDPRGTSTKCPGCGAKLKENEYRRLKYPKCGFEGDRDHIAILNIERRTLAKLQMGGSLTPSTVLQIKDVSPNRCGEPPP